MKKNMLKKTLGAWMAAAVAAGVPVPLLAQTMEEEKICETDLAPVVLSEEEKSNQMLLVDEKGEEEDEFARVVAKYGNMNPEVTQALGFFIEEGYEEAAIIVARGIEDGYVKLNDESDTLMLSNLLMSLDYIDTCNELRTRHDAAALLVEPSMMAISIVQTDWSSDNVGHSQMYYVGENLAWGYSIGAEFGSGSNPFDGWYTEEKEIYDSDPSTDEAGHYLNIVNQSYEITGFAVGSNSTRFRTVFGQTFDWADANYPGMTTEALRKQVNDYMKRNDLVSEESVVMYRLYNPNSGEHFYTTSSAERDHLDRLGWNYEGEAWLSPKNGDPVYRLYNPNAGDHHYTTNAAERDMLVAKGWNDEGIGWYSSTRKSVPVYRQYNPNAKAGAHNFTTSKAENDHLVSLGWKEEGIAWYGAK